MNKTESAENAPAKPLAESLETALEKIRAMSESSKARQTTPPLLNEKQKQERKRRWLDQILKIEAHHPQLQELENQVYDFCSGYIKTPARGRGHRLLIYGENGTAKSHTAKAIARWAKQLRFDQIPQVWDDGYTPYTFGDPGVSELRAAKCEFRNWAKLLKTIKNEQNWGAIRDLCHAEMLILDDVGAEHDPTKFGVGELYQVLEDRERDWTLITTNIGPAHWEERFERRIASRFMRNSVLVPLTEVPDYNSLT